MKTTMKRIPKWGIFVSLFLVVGLMAFAAPVMAQISMQSLRGDVTIADIPARDGTGVRILVDGGVRKTVLPITGARYAVTIDGDDAVDMGQPITFQIKPVGEVWQDAISDPPSPVWTGNPQDVDIDLPGILRPQVTTNAATGVTHRTAILNGSLDDLGDYTQVRARFQYGETILFGLTTNWQTMTTTDGFSAPVSGLTPGNRVPLQGSS